jgi:predicted acyltransferase
VGLLGSYWLAMKLVAVPGCGTGLLDKDCNLARYIDSLFLTGHMWSETKSWDPEGIVSTLPAIATTLFGVLAGQLLRTRRTPAERTAWLFAGGNALIVAGLMMDPWMPINKNLWTASFSVFMAGMATSGFALCYWAVDGNGYQRWSRPFAIYGMNAITVYVLSDVVAQLAGMIHVPADTGWVVLKPFLYELLRVVFSPHNASVAYAAGNVLLLYLVAWAMYRKHWFVKF